MSNYPKRKRKAPERFSDMTFDNQPLKKVKFTLSPFEQNVEWIIRTQKYDDSVKRSRDVRHKMRILRSYFENQDFGELLEITVNHIGTDVDTIQMMWPQIANEMVANEQEY